MADEPSAAAQARDRSPKSSAAQSGAPGESWSQVWQLPVLLLGIGMLVVGVVLALPRHKPPEFDAALNEVDTLLEANQLDAARQKLETIEQELEHSLDRLGMDTVDLYQIHRWDDDTPIETTLGALDDAVRRGTVRHVGASSMCWGRSAKPRSRNRSNTCSGRTRRMKFAWPRPALSGKLPIPLRSTA